MAQIRFENKCEHLNGKMKVGDMWFEYTTFLKDEEDIDGAYLVACVITEAVDGERDDTDYKYNQYILSPDGFAILFAEDLPLDGLWKGYDNVIIYDEWGIMSRDLLLLKLTIEKEHENGYKVRGYDDFIAASKVWVEKFQKICGVCYGGVCYAPVLKFGATDEIKKWVVDFKKCDFDEVHKAYDLGGSDVTFNDYAFENPVDEDHLWDEDNFYADFEAWWDKLPYETQIYILTELGYITKTDK